jgi:hypothetical protein
MAMVRNFEVMLGLTPNKSLYNSVFFLQRLIFVNHVTCNEERLITSFEKFLLLNTTVTNFSFCSVKRELIIFVGKAATTLTLLKGVWPKFRMCSDAT